MEVCACRDVYVEVCACRDVWVRGGVCNHVDVMYYITISIIIHFVL